MKKVKLTSLIAVAILAANVACSGTARAGTDILIDTAGKVTGGYSDKNYAGVAGKDTSQSLEDNVHSIKTVAEVTKSDVWGIYAKGANYVTADSIEGGIVLEAKSSGSVLNNVFAINLTGTGKSNIAELGSISLQGCVSYGINCHGEDGKFGSDIAFHNTGGDISITGDYEAYGIHLSGQGENAIKGLKNITAISPNSTCGIYVISGASNFGASVAFSSTDSSIGVSSNDGVAYGIAKWKNGCKGGSTTVENLGSITVTTSAAAKNACGIYIGGGDTQKYTLNISFKGKGGEAVIATNKSNSANAYSIYDEGDNSETTVNFADSVLSGRIKHTDAGSKLTLNFNSGGVWKQKSGDLTGKVKVSVNSGGCWKPIDNAVQYTGTAEVTLNDGGTLDTRTEVTVPKNIDLGNSTITGNGGKVSFDVKLLDDGVTSDKITASSIDGNLFIGDINLIGTSTAAWEFNTGRIVTLFVGDCTGLNLGGMAEIYTGIGTSDGCKYIFSPSATDLGSLSVLKERGYSLPDIIQGDEEKALAAYSLVGDYNLPEELGTLNNSERSGFIVNGNNHTLFANGYGGGVTINSGDKMTVNDTKLDGFVKFADNSGTLELNGVTFTNVAVADVVNGGTLKLKGKINLCRGIMGSGTTHIIGDTALSQSGKTAAELMQATIIESGATLKGSLLNKENATLTNKGTLGTLGGGDTFDNEGTFANSSMVYSTVTNGGVLTNSIGGTLGSVINSGYLTNDGTIGTVGGNDILDNQGTFTNNGTVYSAVTNKGTLNNSSSGKLGDVTNSSSGTISNNGTFGTSSGSGMLANEGTFTNGGTVCGTVTNSGIFTNNGILGTEGDSNTFNNAGVVVNNGTIYSDVINSGTLELNGSTMIGSVSGSGTVKVYSLNNTVSGDFSAKTLNCYITPTDMNAAGSNTMLNVGGTASFDNATVKAGVLNIGTVAAGSKIALVKAGTLTASGMTTGTLTDGLLKVDLDIAKDGNKIIAKVKGGDTPVTPSTEEDAKSPVETMAASLALVNSGADMLAGEVMQSAAKVVANEKAVGNTSAMMPFASIGGGSTRLNSGSHVDMKSWNIAVSFAKEVENANGKFMFGPVIEYGKGSYDSYLDNGTHGDGSSSFFGLGFMVKQEYKSNFYVEGSIRGGHSENDYSAVINGTDNSYDNSSNYFGAHLGVGKVVPIGEKDNIDYYCKLFYTYQAGSDATLKSGHRYDFDAVNSFRTKLGFRYNHKLNPVSKLYAGLAWQHEFGGECNATVHTGDYTVNAPAPSVKGDTGILELGCKFRTGAHLETGLGLTGSVGKQRGIGGHIEFKWIF